MRLLFFATVIFVVMALGNPVHAQHNHQSASEQTGDGAQAQSHDHADSPMPDQPSDSMNAMDHGDMTMAPMQGGKAPADARDPHAYSDGYTLDTGPYVLPQQERLRLADEHSFWAINIDRLETVDTGDDRATVLDTQLWYGRTYNKWVVKAEGEFSDGTTEELQTDLLKSYAISGFWDAQIGLRNDSGEGPSRNWLALGLQGLAPYWFELDTTLYLGDSGRTALQFEGEYDLLLTQRLILQPRAELNLYGKDDPELGIGAGLSSTAAGLRLRYEFSRRFAPYVGVEWRGSFGKTADFIESAGGVPRATEWVAGVRAWF